MLRVKASNCLGKLTGVHHMWSHADDCFSSIKYPPSSSFLSLKTLPDWRLERKGEGLIKLKPISPIVRKINHLVSQLEVVDVLGDGRNTAWAPCNPGLGHLPSEGFLGVPRAEWLSPEGALLQDLPHGIGLGQGRESPDPLELSASAQVSTQRLLPALPSTLPHLLFHCLGAKATDPLPRELVTHLVNVLGGALLTHPAALTLCIHDLRYWRKLVIVVTAFQLLKLLDHLAQLERYVRSGPLEVVARQWQWRQLREPGDIGDPRERVVDNSFSMRCHADL